MWNIFTGAFIGVLVAHLFIMMREGWERRRRFRAVVELIRFQIEAAPEDRIWNAHHNSIVLLQEQAAHVLNDIQSSRKEAFRGYLIKYSKLTSEGMASFVNADSKTFHPQYPAALQAIIDPLANLIDLANGKPGDLWLATRANKAASRQR